MRIDDSHGDGRTWANRFRAFATDKTAKAVTTRIPGYRTVESHGSALGFGEIGNAWTREHFDGPFFESVPPGRHLPAVNIVFVQSADGNTGADDPSALGGGATDKHLIYEGLSSVHADAIMTGAGTIRGSQMVMAVWHPELVSLRASLGLDRYPAQIVATSTGHLDIDSELLYNVPELRVFILTTTDGASRVMAHARTRPWITVIESGTTSNVVGGLERLYADHGIRRMSCIGGRTLATSVIDAGIVQDLYLTTSPQPGGEPHTPFYTGAHSLRSRLVVKKTGRDDEAGVIFEHSTLSDTTAPVSGFAMGSNL